MQSKERSHDVLTRDVKKGERDRKKHVCILKGLTRFFRRYKRSIFLSGYLPRGRWSSREKKKKKKGTKSSAIALRRCWRSIDDARDARINIVYVSLGVERTSAY